MDPYFFWCFRRGGQFGLDQSGFRNCTAHHERMKARASFQKVLAYDLRQIFLEKKLDVMTERRVANSTLAAAVYFFSLSRPQPMLNKPPIIMAKPRASATLE